MTDEQPAVRPTAEPITAVIADRVRSLRVAAGMSQGDLADAMSAQGVDWKRSTVVNLEKRAPGSRGGGTGRDAVTVQELLSLARIFGTPPTMLLADPRHVANVEVARGVSLPSWDALLWITGIAAVEEATAGAEYTSAAWLVDAGWRIVGALDDLSRGAGDEVDRRALKQIANMMFRISAAGAPMPELPLADLHHRAAALDVHLPGMDT